MKSGGASFACEIPWNEAKFTAPILACTVEGGTKKKTHNKNPHLPRANNPKSFKLKKRLISSRVCFPPQLISHTLTPPMINIWFWCLISGRRVVMVVAARAGPSDCCAVTLCEAEKNWAFLV